MEKRALLGLGSLIFHQEGFPRHHSTLLLPRDHILQATHKYGNLDLLIDKLTNKLYKDPLMDWNPCHGCQSI